MWQPSKDSKPNGHQKSAWAVVWLFFFLAVAAFCIDSPHTYLGVSALCILTAGLMTSYRLRKRTDHSQTASATDSIYAPFRSTVSVHAILGSVLRRLGTKYNQQVLQIEVKPIRGSLNVDFISIESALLKLVDSLANEASDRNVISISVERIGRDIFFRFNSLQTTYIPDKILAFVQTAFRTHGGDIASSRIISGGMFVTLTLPMSVIKS